MTTTTYPTRPVSAAQRSFLTTLLEERAHTPLPSIDEMDSRGASTAITYLLTCPKVVKVAAPAAPAIASRFDGIPLSKYAIAREDIEVLGLDVRLSGDLLFIELRKYKDTVFMRKLTGAPGWFTRTRLSRRDEDLLVKVLELGAEKHAKRFSEAHKCCACCLAELTDQTSRERGFGPVCAKRFGY